MWGILPNPYLVLASLLMSIATGTAGFLVGQHTQENADKAAQAQMIESYDAKIRDLTAQRDAAEKTVADKLAAAAAQYEKESTNAKNQSDALIARLRAGTSKLRVQLANASCSAGVPTTATTAGRSDGNATAVVDPAVAERLAQRVAEYNQIVAELKLAQDTIRMYQDLTAGRSASAASGTDRWPARYASLDLAPAQP